MSKVPGMELSGELERQMPRRALKASRAGPKQPLKWSLQQVAPLVVRKSRQSVDSKFCHPLSRLVDPEGSKAQLATTGDSLPGPEPKVSKNPDEVPMTPPKWMNFKEMVVPDSPEETWACKEPSHGPLRHVSGPEPKVSKHGDEVPSTPPKSTNLEDIIVPDSPEETWACKEPSHRSSKLRRARVREVYPDSEKVGNNAGVKSVDRSESTPLLILKQSGKRTFENESVEQKVGHTQQNHNCAPILAAATINSRISEESVEEFNDRYLGKASELRRFPGAKLTPNFTVHGNAAAVLTPNLDPVCGNPLAASSLATKKARLLLGDESDNCATVAGAGYRTNLPRDVGTPMFGDLEGAAMKTTFSTASGKSVSVSASALKKVMALLGDEFEEVKKGEFAGAGDQRDRHMDIQPPLFTALDGSVPMTSFSTGSGKPLSISSVGLKKARALFGDEIEETEQPAESAGSGYQKNLHMDIQPPMVAAPDCPVPETSFSTESGKPLTISSMALKKARALFGDEVEKTEQPAGSAGPRYQRNLHMDIQPPLFTTQDGTAPFTSFSTGSGKPLSVSFMAVKKGRALFEDEVEETEQPAGSPGAAYQGNLHMNFQAPLFTARDGSVPMTSFSTGNGKPVSISSMALKKARALFGDEVEDTELPAESVRPAHMDIHTRLYTAPDGSVPFNSFSTGSGKPLSISSMYLVKARALLGDDVEDSEFSVKFSGAGYQRSLPRDNAGTAPIANFATASGMQMYDSATPLNKATALVGDRGMEDRTAGGLPLTASFSTASGKPSSVSSSVTKKARVLLQDEAVENENYPDSSSIQVPGHQLPSRMTDKSKFVVGSSKLDATMFHRGNAGHPSAEAAHTSLREKDMPVSATFAENEKRRSLYGDGEKENYASFGGATYQPHQAAENSESAADKTTKLQTPLQTGAGGPISQSVATPECEMSDKMDGVFSFFRDQSMDGSPSFRTRTGRIVTISGEAMEKARALLADGERKANLTEPFGPGLGYIENPEGRPTFQTGSGRTVTVSREAVQRANFLLAEGERKASLRASTDCCSSAEQIGQVPSATPSVRTSSGRIVTASSEAMARFNEQLPPNQKHLAAHSPFHDRGLNAADSRYGRPIIIANESPQFSLHNGKLPATVGGDNQLRNVRAFKPPRPLWKQPEASITSREKVATEGTPSASELNSLQNQRRASNSSSAFSGRNQALPLRSAYLLDGDGRSRSGWMKLSEYIRGPPVVESEVFSLSTEVRLMTADAAENHRIQCISVDGEQESLGSLEVWKLLQGLGANPRHATKEWVANHYKWIVWKLASFERKYPRQAARKLLTLDTVLHELKHRYDKELSGSRSAIRRITEEVSLASQPMILCVSAVRHYGDIEGLDQPAGQLPIDRTANGKEQQAGQTAKIEVTDGWYRLNAVLDAPLTKQLQKGKLKIGQKIQVCRASLCCCPDGTSPSEAFQDSFLMLHMNGTYRARGDQRLGFCRGPLITLAFKCIKPDGGLVPQTCVGVTRVYPILYKETSAGGISVTRSARAEQLALDQFEHRRTKVMEEAMLKLETSYNPSLSDDGKDEGVELFAAVESAAEPDILMADMSPTQLKAFAAYQARRATSRQAATEDAIKEALQDAGLDSRNVKCLLKVRVTGLKCQGSSEVHEGERMKEGLITLWDMNDDQYLREGSVYCVSGLKPVTWGSSRSKDQLHLNSFNSARWRQIPDAVYKNHFFFPYAPRAPTQLSELDEKHVGREFDVAAMVFHVEEPFSSGNHMDQWVFLADGSSGRNFPGDTWDETQVLAVHVRLLSQAFVPLENSLVGSVIGYCNLLQQPKDHNNRFWIAEASEQAIFSSNLTHLPLRHLQTAGDSVSKCFKSAPWMADQLRDLLPPLMSIGLT